MRVFIVGGSFRGDQVLAHSVSRGVAWGTLEYTARRSDDARSNAAEMLATRRLSQTTVSILLAACCGALMGCGDIERVERVSRSWELSRFAAREVHRGDAAILCASFSDEMLAVVSCEALERLLEQVREEMGQAVDECRWAYTYRIASLDPLVATAIRSCPFRNGDLSVTVTAEVGPNEGRIVGLWLDAPAIRGLSLDP